MIDRLANVLYWLSCAAAVLFGALMVVVAIGDKAPPLLAVAAGGALLIWLFGRIARYVLIGR